ncbi:MAG: hypothetical protein JO112_20375, partial [Planctomycetes bacterium]|nr:hypothetical protein [Planctomycetota bacterium]
MRKDYTQSSNIFHNLDSALLSPERQAKLRELILMPELQPQAVVQAAAKMPASDGSPGEPGKAMVSDAGSSPKTPEQNYARQVQAMQDIQFQALRDKGFKASREAATAAQAGNFDQSVDILNTYLDSLKNSSLEPERAALLRKPIEHRIQMFQTMKDQAAAAQKKIDSQAAFVQGKLRQVKAEENKDKQVTSLMAEYHSLYEQGKYAEAEVKAAQALELDPGNPQVSAAVQMARMARNHAIYDKIKHDKEDMFLAGVNDAEKVGPPVNSDNPLAFNGQVWDRAKVRKGSKDFELLNKKTNKEREIEHRLDTPTSLDFKETPLRQVLEDLSATNQINIVPDEPALNDAGISLDRPLNMKLEGVSLKSALDLLLGQAHLTYVIKDEVLLVTTEAHARGKMIQKIYPVADIVIPIENHGNLDNPMVRALQQGSAPTTPMGGPGSYPWRNDVQGASMVSTGGSMADMANQPAASSPGSMNSPRPPGQTLQELLMELITNTVAPGSWSKVGGQATIDYFPLGMALVVTQTPDIQEQIADLLTALRRLQDLEVAVEVRFITLDEAFYERIGVNFSVDVLNKGSKATQTLNQLAVTNGNASQVTGPVTVGLTPGGSFTSALDIPITNSSFGPAIPPFGGFPNAPGADGGISLGLAFLSDIQVFMFMEAAQADRRTNVMQAPKITLFNGQTSTLSITDNQFFVTNVQVTGFGGQLVFNPQNTLQQTGVSLSMNAVVTADRRFVRMSLTPVLSNIASPVTALFPITAFITPV